MLTAGCKRGHRFVRFCSCPDTSNSGHGYSLTSRNGLNARAYCLFPSTPTQQIQTREGRQSLTKSQTLFPIEGRERTSSCYNELWWDTAPPRQRRAAAGLCCFWEGSFCFLSLLKPHWYQEGNSSENSTWQEISKTLICCKSPQDRW